MNIYFLGMCIAMVIYLIVGFAVSKRIESTEDFYVAGRRAPVLLIAGSMIASYASTGMFMGDAAQCYDGVFSPIILFAGMQSAGYIIGAVFFGRYLRRSKALTIPEFFGERFCSHKMRTLSAVIAIITMTVYLLSVMQGIGTLMTVVTGVNYNICIVLALIVFTLISVLSGSRGVLITDTLMASVFTAALVVAALFIAKNTGGWYDAIETLASHPDTADLLSWGGRAGPLYEDGVSNVIWGLTYGIVWMSVCMVGPWQASRYQMARNEHVIIRSSIYSAVGVFALEFLSGIAAVMVRIAYPAMEDSSRVMIWASMNLMPKLLGVVLLTGILSAGISSATTFLSLIGASVANDVVGEHCRTKIAIGRIAMVIVSLIVLFIAVYNPPAIFWIMFLGGAIVASSWMPVALACVFSKRLTCAGAFAGMLVGFLGCFFVKIGTNLLQITLPAYLDASIIGIVCNIVAMVLVSALTQPTEGEVRQRLQLFRIPESEKNPREVAGTLHGMKLAIFMGIAVTAALLLLWVIPYYQGIALQ